MRILRVSASILALALLAASSACDDGSGDPRINPTFRTCADEDPDRFYYWEKFWIALPTDEGPELHCVRSTSCDPTSIEQLCGTTDPFENVSYCIGANELDDTFALTSTGSQGICLIPCDPADPQGCYFGTCTFVSTLEDSNYVCIP